MDCSGLQWIEWSVGQSRSRCLRSCQRSRKAGATAKEAEEAEGTKGAKGAKGTKGAKEAKEMKEALQEKEEKWRRVPLSCVNSCISLIFSDTKRLSLIQVDQLEQAS